MSVSDAPNVTSFDRALFSPILGTFSLSVDWTLRGEDAYFSLKPPPTPAPFLFTETVASSKPHVAAAPREGAQRSKVKDRN